MLANHQRKLLEFCLLSRHYHCTVFVVFGSINVLTAVIMHITVPSYKYLKYCCPSCLITAPSYKYLKYCCPSCLMMAPVYLISSNLRSFWGKSPTFMYFTGYNFRHLCLRCFLLDVGYEICHSLEVQYSLEILLAAMTVQVTWNRICNCFVIFD